MFNENELKALIFFLSRVTVEGDEQDGIVMLKNKCRALLQPKKEVAKVINTPEKETKKDGKNN